MSLIDNITRIALFEELGQHFNAPPLIPPAITGLYWRSGAWRFRVGSGPEQTFSVGGPGTYVQRAGDTMTGVLDMSGNTITGLPLPASNPEAANKQYVDVIAVGGGISAKEPVRAATVANIALSGVQTIDGVMLMVGDRVLVKDQVLGQNNGIYVVSAGAWLRSNDANEDFEVNPGMFCFTYEGTQNGSIGFILTTPDPITVGTTPLAFSPFTNYKIYDADGMGLELTGGTFFLELDGSTLSKSFSGLKVNSVPASIVTNVPAGDISATNVQAAINELDQEKASIDRSIINALVFG